jgi:hypothetical protein
LDGIFPIDYFLKLFPENIKIYGFENHNFPLEQTLPEKYKEQDACRNRD